MIYCDSSFLVALYVKRDFFHLQASKIAAQFREPIAYTPLSELELINGVCRNLAAKLIVPGEMDAIFRQISEDEADDIIIRRTLDQSDHYARARELSRK
jgi:hypothetical protein